MKVQATKEFCFKGIEIRKDGFVTFKTNDEFNYMEIPFGVFTDAYALIKKYEAKKNAVKENEIILNEI